MVDAFEFGLQAIDFELLSQAFVLQLLSFGDLFGEVQQSLGHVIGLLDAFGVGVGKGCTVGKGVEKGTECVGIGSAGLECRVDA